MRFGEKEFLEIFYYEHTRPSSMSDLIGMALGFLESDELSFQRRASAGVVGIYKCVEHELTEELRHFHSATEALIEKISEAASGAVIVKGIRDDFKQVLISVLTALWHSDVIQGKNPRAGLERLRNEVGSFPYLKVTYSQNVARSITLLAYMSFSRGELDKAKSEIEWFVDFFYRLTDDIKLIKYMGSSHCGDLYKTVGLLQVCMAGKEWIDGTRMRQNLWSPSKLLVVCPRVNKGLSKSFDRNFIRLLES